SLLLVLLIFAFRAQFGANDYIEWAAVQDGPFHLRANADGLLLFKFPGKRIGGIQNIHGPYWLLIPILSFVPACITWKVWREHRQTLRRSAGLCPTCGYDLHATPDCCP